MRKIEIARYQPVIESALVVHCRAANEEELFVCLGGISPHEVIVGYLVQETHTAVRVGIVRPHQWIVRFAGKATDPSLRWRVRPKKFVAESRDALPTIIGHS